MKTRHKIISLSSILVMGVLAAAPAAVVSWTLVNTDQATFFSNPVLSGGSGFSNNLAATPPLNFEGITSPGTSRANHLNQPFSTITENSGNPFWGANYAYDKISHDGGSAASFRAYTTDDPSHTGEQARLDLYDSTGNYTGLINVLNGMAVGQTKSFAMTMDYRMAEKAGNGVIYMNPEFYVPYLSDKRQRALSFAPDFVPLPMSQAEVQIGRAHV